jgi:hypothetical protein
MPCPNGDGRCTVGESAVAMEHGQVFLTTREELADRWEVDLENVRPRVRVDATLQAVLDAHVQAVQASEEGVAMQAMPMPEKVARHARLVVVECDPCGHRFMAEL